MEIRKSRKFFVCGGVMVCLALGTGIFFFRAPVLLVTDAPFNALYGLRRSRIKSIETSLKLFRQVKPVLVAENAGPDMVAFAVESAAPAPYCVLFPYWYNEGAGRYAEQFPQVPVFILGGRNRDPQVQGTIFIGTDWETDLYRAGLCAGIIARHNGDKEVLFFQNEGLTTEQRNAFRDGLQEQGFENAPKYLSITEHYSDNNNISCVVMNGAATSFLDQNVETSIILFSWIDPGVTATSVKVVFDDSPWALAPGVIKMIPGEHPVGLIPSEILFLGRRIPEKGIVRDLKKVLQTDRAYDKKRLQT
jgi:hypothetical protein